MQHQLGQHYSENKELLINYNTELLKITNKVIVDPFIGEGAMILYYLSLFEDDVATQMILDQKIMGFDIFPDNIEFIKNKINSIYGVDFSVLDELFKQRDSFLDTSLPKNSFVLTNPPYLAKNVVKKLYKDDFDKYFLHKYPKFNDYFEIALECYGKFDGLWIVPANLFSSDIMSRCREKTLSRIDNIFIYEKSMFSDTDISATTFLIHKDDLCDSIKTFNFIGNSKNINSIDFSFVDNTLMVDWNLIKNTKNSLNIKQGFIDTKFVEGKKKIKLIDTSYKENDFKVSDSDLNLLKNNPLILRTTDTGTDGGKLGLYTIEEIFGPFKDKNNLPIGLMTKISSRVYTQLFFPDTIPVKRQLELKDEFNKSINSFRDKYNSLFLTNFKNSSNGKQRKRISYKDVYALLNNIQNNSKK